MTSSATLKRINDEKSSSVEAEDLKEKMKDLRTNVATTALTIVHEIMPSKVIELHHLFSDDPLFNMKLTEVNQYTSSILQKNISTKPLEESSSQDRKKRKVNSEVKKDQEEEKLSILNKVIADIMFILKKEIVGLIEMINTVKIWIQLNIPRIEDGNNFGVSIQEESVNELGRAEDSGFAVLENMTKYYVTRAKLVSKLEKYPHIPDYHQSIVELDEKEYINLRLCCLDLRNSYAILHDMITKNLEKIKTPRSTNHMSSLF